MYSRQVNDRELSFGVSGMLYKSNVLMYDHQTESLWSQVRREAVTGPLTGARLKVLPSTLTTWRKWLKQHPQTEVLSLDTGHRRDYRQDPYADYYESKSGMFSFFKPGDTLQSGLWPSMDALPAAEQARRGTPIVMPDLLC